MKRSKKITITIIVVIFIITVAALIYLSTGNYTAQDLAKSYMFSDENVTVLDDNGINFIPSAPNGIGVILYQGAKVETSAYSVEGRTLAENGYTVFIPKMPFNMAFFGINKADKIIKENPEILNWYMAGHSLGGSMAAKYTYKNQKSIDGLLLLASYSVDDLSGYSGRVISIVGTKDMGIDSSKLDETSKNLPYDYELFLIEGGNHAQFGDYGFQKGDFVADILPEEQLKLIIDKMLEFLHNE